MMAAGLAAGHATRVPMQNNSELVRSSARLTTIQCTAQLATFVTLIDPNTQLGHLRIATE